MRLPVLALPERVELPVARAARAPAWPTPSRARGRPGRGRRRLPYMPARSRLELPLALLALELLVVVALPAVDPAADQRDRVEVALDLGALLLHRLVRGQLARRHRLVGLEVHARDRPGLVVLGLLGGDPQRLAVAHLHEPGAALLAAHVVTDRERVAARPLGVDHVRQRRGRARRGRACRRQRTTSPSDDVGARRARAAAGPCGACRGCAGGP